MGTAEIKRGDLVKVVRKPSREELEEWIEDEWVESMDDYVSAIGKVEYLGGHRTACLRFGDEEHFFFGYPFFSLEKVDGYWDDKKGEPVYE